MFLFTAFSALPLKTQGEREREYILCRFHTVATIQFLPHKLQNHTKLQSLRHPAISETTQQFAKNRPKSLCAGFRRSILSTFGGLLQFSWDACHMPKHCNLQFCSRFGMEKRLLATCSKLHRYQWLCTSLARRHCKFRVFLVSKGKKQVRIPMFWASSYYETKKG